MYFLTTTSTLVSRFMFVGYGDGGGSHMIRMEH